ncbi:MAG: HAMP domain-containing protein [Acidobacteria bacterium]|nr:HAMP domain-containing protein [Acidobacteriota bacterium]
MAFRSLKNKLLTMMIALALVTLMGISLYAYFIVTKQVAQDRIQLSLEKMARDTADTIFFMLKQKKEEVNSMARTLPLIYPTLGGEGGRSIIPILNSFCFDHEVYDLLIVLDSNGKIVATNTLDRNWVPLPADRIRQIMGSSIEDYPEEYKIFRESMGGYSSHHDWYQSRLVQRLYDYSADDSSHLYNIALSETLRHPRTSEILGVWISIINWFYVQNILDNVEMDLANSDLKSGYAFMLASDADTTIGHKFRRNRPVDFRTPFFSAQGTDLYGTRIVAQHGLCSLREAILRQQRSVAYEFPKGNSKISGIARIDDASFPWIVGVGVDGTDIYRPIYAMTWRLAAVTGFLSALVVVFTYFIARGITVPLNNLIRTARTIAHGDFNERVLVRSADEVGVLGSTFNDMARALSAREEQLQELNKNLEEMVRQRTLELEQSNAALRQAYLELQNAQEQLVQTEKMASLGQLVAGIAHEIKNPLNFIYGNTGFLADYAARLRSLIEAYESLPSLSVEDRSKMDQLKEKMRYSFIKEDLHTLIDNFTEGARRINAIVSDLRSFSRMDSDQLSEIDLHAALEMTLNLLTNQYKNRIEIHREFGAIPKIQGYAGKLNQVLMNLLLNAFQAIEGQGDVWIRTRSLNGAVEVEIEDSGTGIPKEHIKRIFEPFFTTKPIGQGTGLGLSISYGIIEQHGGKIHVSSAPNKGIIFTIRLPVFQERPAS